MKGKKMSKNSNRTTNSIKNTIASTSVYIVTIILGFISQSIFIRILGAEYNGIKGLFSNILNMLSIAELGFGSAIVYHLYKPMAEKNTQQIKILVKYYRNVYHTIAYVILGIGILILPILPTVVGEVSIPENVIFLFFLYLLSTVFSYLLTYKRSVLYADQKNYVINIVNGIFIILKNIAQITIIVWTQNFVAYLINQIVFAILENVIINRIVNRKYTYVRNLKDCKEISNELKKDITVKVKGLLFHKIGCFIVLGTDNIIISMTKGLGVVAVGMYANYNMIIGQVRNLFASMFASLTASVGNLLVEKDKRKARDIYKSILLLNSWLFSFGAISIYCMIEPFVKIWIGGEYILSKFVLITLVINLYIQGIRSTSSMFSEAGGIFYENRFVPIIESIVNMIASLIFVQIFGFAGVFLGTILSTMILFFYSYPKYVYKLVLDGTYQEYFQLLFKHVLITISIGLITGLISSFIRVQSAWIELILNGILCFILPNMLYFLFAMKMPEFDFYREKLRNMLSNKR